MAACEVIILYHILAAKMPRFVDATARAAGQEPDEHQNCWPGRPAGRRLEPRHLARIGWQEAGTKSWVTGFCL